MYAHDMRQLSFSEFILPFGCILIQDHISWNNFNESGQLISQTETYRKRHGHYPQSVHGDKIYRTKANRAWCKARGIRLSGPLLGRALKATPENHQQILKNRCIARQDERDRIPIEGKFGQSKRRFSLDRVMTKLAITSQCSIALTFLMINLEKGLRLLFLFLFLLQFPRNIGIRTLYKCYRNQKTIPLAV